MFKKIFNFILGLLLPVECLGCNKEGVYLCDNCLTKIKIYDRPEPFDHPLKYLEQVWSAADYRQGLLQKAIHYFKFRFIKELAKPLTKILIEFYQKRKTELNPAGPMIIPVPLNKKRFLERGFNQSEMMAEIFAEHFGFEFCSNAVIRHKNTAHQVGLTKKQRKTNVKNSFRVAKAVLIKDKEIILIDDVVTTGSTLEEIAGVLRQAGAKKVIGLTLAKD
ncbi:MAG TPA: ComF family protein [Patescibacteria group bacterium]|nr:ComF family protein [Patescibacteria group bacterium]